MINSVLLIVYFILHYHLFFRKKYFFVCLYFSEYDIRMFLFVFWWRTSLSIKYVLKRGSGRGDTQNVSRYVKGKGFEKSVIRYVRTKWMPLNICCRIFFVRWLVMHESITTSKEKVVIFFHHNYNFLILCDN